MEIKTALMIADNPKHQGNLNRALNWLVKYNEFNTQRDLAEDLGDKDRVWQRWNDKCEKAFDKYEDYCYLLPKGQVKKIEKSLYY